MQKKLFFSFARLIKGTAVGVFVLLAVASIGFAQTQSTTGTIQGAVTDANGA